MMQLALQNSVRRFGPTLAKNRTLVAHGMKVARKTFPTHILMGIGGTARLPAFIKAERKRMREYARTLR